MSDIDIGRIYEIVCPLDPDWRYIGATFRPLNERFSIHKCNFRRWQQGKIKYACSCFQHFALFGLENHSIRLIKEYPVVRLGPQDHKHLSVYETLWQRQLKCCNKNTPCNLLQVIENRGKYKSDPEFREKVLARQNQKYKSDPKFREKQLARKNQKYQSDPEFREKQLERMRERYHRKKVEREAAASLEKSN